MNEQLYTPEDASRRLNVTRGTIYRWLREKRIGHVRMGKGQKAHLFIPQSAIDKFLGDGKVEAK